MSECPAAAPRPDLSRALELLPQLHGLVRSPWPCGSNVRAAASSGRRPYPRIYTSSEQSLLCAMSLSSTCVPMKCCYSMRGTARILTWRLGVSAVVSLQLLRLQAVYRLVSQHAACSFVCSQGLRLDSAYRQVQVVTSVELLLPRIAPLVSGLVFARSSLHKAFAVPAASDEHSQCLINLK